MLWLKGFDQFLGCLLMEVSQNQGLAIDNDLSLLYSLTLGKPLNDSRDRLGELVRRSLPAMIVVGIIPPTRTTSIPRLFVGVDFTL